MKRGQIPVSVYRLTSEQLVAEYHTLCDQAEQLSPNQHARLYFVNEEMKARGLPSGLPAPAAKAQDDAWDGEL
ncbi:hypothetical protein [Rhodococcus erythropolis]|uniref:hypothetical protein n=1 Tax=Rhodococcus erythropolis TaxID=1833 RepID=UPI000878D25E|nr:hypothetical protein [Rhodococcus erythropolis]OFV79290.1 hypothetical protein RERY_00470 [Rhodococcus erythropolis]